jgi:hypothetical protein
MILDVSWNGLRSLLLGSHNVVVTALGSAVKWPRERGEARRAKRREQENPHCFSDLLLQGSSQESPSLCFLCSLDHHDFVFVVHHPKPLTTTPPPAPISISTSSGFNLTCKFHQVIALFSLNFATQSLSIACFRNFQVWVHDKCMSLAAGCGSCVAELVYEKLMMMMRMWQG